MQLCCARNKRRRSAARYHGLANVVSKRARKGFTIRYNPDARVDGSYDEGPSHLEVQFWWTVRHLTTSTRTVLVTSRHSGASNKNRVELQNGCLALAHANLFIPSTLNGSCLDGGGKVNEKVLRENLSSAIDIYISRVDKAPCAGTEINLYRGSDSSSYQKENELVKIFLKGSKASKEKLKTDHPDEFQRIKQIWDVRESHLRKDLPIKYILCLPCCKEGAPSDDVRWYPGGPPMSYP